MARALAATIVIAIFYGHCHYEDTCHYATTKTGLRKNTLLRILSTYNFFSFFFNFLCHNKLFTGSHSFGSVNSKMARVTRNRNTSEAISIMAKEHFHEEKNARHFFSLVHFCFVSFFSLLFFYRQGEILYFALVGTIASIAEWMLRLFSQCKEFQ